MGTLYAAYELLEAQFCVSNTALMDVLADTVIDLIRGKWKNEEVFELAGFDTWGKSCQCAGCAALGNRMSEYTFGINFEAYTPESEIRTALHHSQLTNLYYKILANKNKGGK